MNKLKNPFHLSAKEINTDSNFPKQIPNGFTELSNFQFFNSERKRNALLFNRDIVHYNIRNISDIWKTNQNKDYSNILSLLYEHLFDPVVAYTYSEIRHRQLAKRINDYKDTIVSIVVSNLYEEFETLNGISEVLHLKFKTIDNTVIVRGKEFSYKLETFKSGNKACGYTEFGGQDAVFRFVDRYSYVCAFNPTCFLSMVQSRYDTEGYEYIFRTPDCDLFI